MRHINLEMFIKSILTILFVNLIVAISTVGCYTVVEKKKVVDDNVINPYKNREFIGRWIHYDYVTPLLSFRKTSLLTLLPNRSYFFYPDFYRDPYHYLSGEYYVIADTILFNPHDRINLAKYLYIVNSDTLMLQPVDNIEIQFWYKEKKSTKFPIRY